MLFGKTFPSLKGRARNQIKISSKDTGETTEVKSYPGGQEFPLSPTSAISRRVSVNYTLSHLPYIVFTFIHEESNVQLNLQINIHLVIKEILGPSLVNKHNQVRNKVFFSRLLLKSSYLTSFNTVFE